MSIDYEKISDEWLEYIGTLDLEERKKKFQQYLEASGVYDLDSSTTFYLSELNNFLTEGITTLLHDKAQQAKKSGKGLAHYRHTSFALSKPDAMNIVHSYIHNKILSHPTMSDTAEMPNKFKWDFLFNVPEYVNNKAPLTPNEIPQLPEPHKRGTEQTLNYSPDQYTDDKMENNEYSPDPFDIDGEIDKQQIIENIKDKIYANEAIKELEEHQDDEEYSPDPFDIDEEQKQYTTSHMTTESAVQKVDIDEPITFGGIKHGHIEERRETTLIAGGADTMAEGLSKLQREKSNYLESYFEKKKEDEKEEVHDIEDKDKIVDCTEIEDDNKNHKKATSTIPGGYWKNQLEQSDKLMHNLNDATEHRDQILLCINSNSDIHKEDIANVLRSIVDLGGIIRQKEEDNIKIFDLEKEIERKNALIQEQNIKIKEFEMNENRNDILKEILTLIQKEKQNEKMNEIIDKTEEIQIKLGSLHKFEQQIKQQNVSINEIQINNDKYYNETVKKMAQYHDKLNSNINKIQINNNNNNNNNDNMTVLTHLTAQLGHDMSAASMLSVMRNEYDNMRKEKDEMRIEIERYRKENQRLLLKKVELEEEAINVRESKRRTIKNLVDELNDMRDQIYKLSKR